MTGKNDDSIDLEEIRRLIGGDSPEPEREFSLDEIITEVNDGRKKEIQERRKKEEEENPFLFLVNETREFDASDNIAQNPSGQTGDAGEAYLKEVMQSLEFSMPAGKEAPTERKPEEAAPSSLETKKSAGETLPEERVKNRVMQESGETSVINESSANEEAETKARADAGKAASNPRPIDFDRTEFETAEQAVKYYKKRGTRLNMKASLVLGLSLIGGYLTFAPTFALPTPLDFSYAKTPYLYLFALIILETLSMLAALDLIAAGVMRLIGGRPSIYSLVALSSFASLLHAVSIVLFPRWGGYLPFTSLSSLLIFFMLFSTGQKKSALMRSYKAQTLSSEPVALKLEKESVKKACVFRAAEGDLQKFRSELSSPDPAERFFGYYVPCAIVASLVFAIVATVGQDRPELFLWAFSGIITVSSPWGLLIAYSTPAKAVTKKMLSFGAGLFGWGSTNKVFACRAVVLKDSDIFPPQTISLKGIKAFSPHTAEKVLYLAGSVIIQSEMGMKKVFQDLMREQYITPCSVSELQFFETGGISAMIGDDHILVGTPTFLLRMGVRIPEGVRIKNGVFVAVNASLAGIFALKYEALPQVEGAFRLLKRLKITPILAVRDFNLTPGMLENKFKLKPQWTEYPEINSRLLLSDAYRGEADDTVAFLSRDGIVPLSEYLFLCKKLCHATRVNLIIGASGGILGILMMFYLSFHAAVSAATPYNTAVYLLLWLVPVLLSSFGASRY